VADPSRPWKRRTLLRARVGPRRAVRATTRVRLETVPVRFEDKVSIVMSRRVDMTIAPLLDTLDRRKDVDFVDYSTSAQCFFGLADNAVVSLATRVDDLNQPNVTVGYVAGSPQGAWLMKRLPNAAKIGLKLAPTDVPVNAVITRRVDVAPIDIINTSSLVSHEEYPAS